jgi:hypothetical protein
VSLLGRAPAQAVGPDLVAEQKTGKALKMLRAEADLYFLLPYITALAPQ